VSSLSGWAREQGITLQTVPLSVAQSYHMFYLLLPSRAVRDRLIAHLKQRGILAVFHYLALNTSKVGVSIGGRAGDCPVAERVADQLLRLPFYTNMTDVEQSDVIEALHLFR
jgi:dTDP-4-amino-4,6-dideoxygalactose transaminase